MCTSELSDLKEMVANAESGPSALSALQLFLKTLGSDIDFLARCKQIADSRIDRKLEAAARAFLGEDVSLAGTRLWSFSAARFIHTHLIIERRPTTLIYFGDLMKGLIGMERSDNKTDCAIFSLDALITDALNSKRYSLLVQKGIKAKRK
jgi:hypothetical protein